MAALSEPAAMLARRAFICEMLADADAHVDWVEGCGGQHTHIVRLMQERRGWWMERLEVLTAEERLHA